MATATKNPASAKPVIDLPNFDEWEDRQVGFSPYWQPQVGSWCFGQLVGRDDRNPAFVRYLFKAYAEIDCRTGPANEDADEGPMGEIVKVKKGETFTMSVFHALADELDFQLWLQRKYTVDIPVRIDVVKKVPTKHLEGRKVWKFRVRCSPEHKKLLDSNQQTWRELTSGGPDRPALET